MKITLNLSPAPSWRDRYALAWAVPITVAGLAVLILLGRGTSRELREYRTIGTQLAEVQTRSSDLQNQEANLRRRLDDPESQDLLRRAKFLNGLIDRKQLSLSEVSARVAGLLPENARLTGLALSSPKQVGDDYTLRLGINAKNEDAIETFINDLEAAPDFKEVTIINQGFQEESSQPDPFNIICTAKYVPGTDLSVEKSDASAGKND